MFEKQYWKLASWVLEARFQSKYQVSNTRIQLVDLCIFCHIDLESYRLEFVKSKFESTTLDFYSETNQNKSDQAGTKKQRTEGQRNKEWRNGLGRKKKKKKKKRRRRGRRTEDQIRQEEENSDLKGRVRCGRKKKRTEEEEDSDVEEERELEF